MLFVGFGRVRWIRVEMATYLDGSGKIWMALSGFDWIWEDVVGFSWIWCRFVCGFSKSDFVGYGGIYRDYRRIWMDLA